MSAPTAKTLKPSTWLQTAASAALFLPPRSQIRPITALRQHLDAWLKSRNIIGISGVDTRALTVLIREKGVPNGVIAHDPDGNFDLDNLKLAAANWPGLVGMDLAKDVSTTQTHQMDKRPGLGTKGIWMPTGGKFKVVALDFGIKRNILRLLTDAGCDVTVLPATATSEDILAQA
jgi:carbamoyl-phosphate synthase small subunit